MKIVLWSLLGIGLLPCIFVAFQGLMYLQFLQLMRRLPTVFRRGILHDSYFRIQVGTWEFELYPRLWAFALLTAGIIAIVASLIVLLHVPLGPSNERLTNSSIPPVTPGLG